MVETMAVHNPFMPFEVLKNLEAFLTWVGLFIFILFKSYYVRSYFSKQFSMLIYKFQLQGYVENGAFVFNPDYRNLRQDVLDQILNLCPYIFGFLIFSLNK